MFQSFCKTRKIQTEENSFVRTFLTIRIQNIDRKTHISLIKRTFGMGRLFFLIFFMLKSFLYKSQGLLALSTRCTGLTVNSNNQDKSCVRVFAHENFSGLILNLHLFFYLLCICYCYLLYNNILVFVSMHTSACTGFRRTYLPQTVICTKNFIRTTSNSSVTY